MALKFKVKGLLCLVSFLIVFLFILGTCSATVNLEAPTNNTLTSEDNDTIQFIYNRSTSLGGIVDCSLLIDSVFNAEDLNVPPDSSRTVYANQSIVEGNRNWFISCNNSTGSWDNSSIYTLSIDRINPSITIVVPSDYNQSLYRAWYYVNITLNEAGNNANLEDNFSGTFTNYSMTQGTTNNEWYINRTGLSDGNATFRIYANDTVNNTGKTGDSWVDVDTTPPGITIVTPTDINISVDRNWTYFNITLNERGNNANVEVNNTNYSMVQGTDNQEWFYNLTDLDVGNYTYRFFANDTLNNTGLTGFSWVNISWSPVDETAPEITIVTPTDINISVDRNWTYFNISLDEPGNSADVEVNSTNYSMVQGTTNQEWFYNLTQLDVGNYTYRFFANDTSNNTGLTGFSWVNISWSPTDTTPPTITFVTPTPDNESLVQNWIYVNVTLSESGNSANLDWDGTNYSMTQGTTNIEWFLNVSLQPDGNYTFMVYANDTSDNTGISVEVWVYLDTTPPATVTNLQDIANSTTWIYWNWTDPIDSDFDHVEVYLDGIFKVNTSDNYYNATGLSSGTEYEIQTRTVDTLGNINIIWVNDTAKTKNIIITEEEEPRGRGGGGGFILEVERIRLDFTATDTVTVEMSVGDVVVYPHESGDHTIALNAVTETSVKLIIRSEIQIIKLNISEVALVDVNSDGTYDLAITLRGIVNGRADVIFKNLVVAKVIEVPETGDEDNESFVEVPESKKTGLFILGKVSPFTALIIGCITLVVALFISFKYRLIELKLPFRKAEAAPKLKVNGRMRTMIDVMSEREQQIVQFLIECNGKITQAKIRKHTGIPNTSLCRWIRSLERKKVIETFKVGKVRKVRLSKGFIESEKAE